VRNDWLWPGSIYRQLPDLGCVRYIADYWDKAGRAINGGMGRIPLNWQELGAMQNLLGIRLRPWEAECIVEMSRTYCANAASSDRHDPAPYSPTDDERELAIERGHQNEHGMRM